MYIRWHFLIVIWSWVNRWHLVCAIMEYHFTGYITFSFKWLKPNCCHSLHGLNKKMSSEIIFYRTANISNNNRRNEPLPDGQSPIFYFFLLTLSFISYDMITIFALYYYEIVCSISFENGFAHNLFALLLCIKLCLPILQNISFSSIYLFKYTCILV